MTAEPVNREALALKPCPFCGGDGSVLTGRHSHSDATVECLKCDAEGPLCDDAKDFPTEKVAKAIAAWNSRPDAERAEGGEDEGCGKCAYRDLGAYELCWGGPPPSTPSSTGGEGLEEIAKTLYGDLQRLGSGMVDYADFGQMSRGVWVQYVKRALSRPQPVAETVEAREFIENWFAPWGSWKTAWWEMAVSDDVEMTDANALKALRKILAALRPSAHGEAG